MPQFQNFTAEDKIIEPVVVTKGFHSGDLGTVVGSSFVTSSLTASQQEYYANVSYNSVDHFSATFGNINGSGSDDTVGQTKAIYKQMSDILLFPDDIENNGFQFDGSTTEENVYFLVANRSRMKDRVNKKNWTMHLSGSSTSQNLGASVSLTDDSADVAPTATPVGSRYNIVEGALGVVTTPATTKTYGWFYPDMGIFALAETQMSTSIPGTPFSPSASGESGTTLLSSASGFTFDDHADAQNHMKLVAGISASATGITMRNEERQITTSYFVRCKANQWNCSNNPTFTSESKQDNSYAIKEMTGNPSTFITEVGLFSGNNKLVAVGKLSAPVHKSFNDEAYIKVNLVY